MGLNSLSPTPVFSWQGAVEGFFTLLLIEAMNRTDVWILHIR